MIELVSPDNSGDTTQEAAIKRKKNIQDSPTVTLKVKILFTDAGQKKKPSTQLL